MAALVQAIPTHNSINIMQGRPGSAERYGSQVPYRNIQKHSNTPSTGYRGLSGPAPTYAFTSTPQLGTSNNQRQQPSHQHHPRASSSSTVPQLPQLNLGMSGFSQRSPLLQASSAPLSNNTNPIQFSLDDDGQPVGAVNAASSTMAKPSPDRYRRTTKRTDSSEGSGISQANNQVYNHPGQSTSSPSLTNYQSYRATTYTAGAQTRKTSNDDMLVGRQNPELASRYRRRSFGSIEVAGLNHTGDAQDTSSPHPNAVIPNTAAPSDYISSQQSRRPTSSHTHTGSSDSVASRSSGRSSRPGSARNESSNSSVAAPGPTHSTVLKQDPRNLHVPGAHVQGGRRVPSPLSNPSPLSRPMDMNGEETGSTTAVQGMRSKTMTPMISSPAAEQLAALNLKEQKKPKSKLRRAFSFGSAAELRKATAQANLEKSTQAAAAAGAVGNKRNSKFEDELDPEQARIAERQEAAGLGESIYSGQGNFFTGSTDNLSVSSTASSASIMLRKMGKGMKKGTRSLVGLFRPKSVLGVPAADGPVNAASAAQISMVTVEAEREKVNVNADLHAHHAGGTGFPKLERNSIDNKMSMDSGSISHDSRSRRSIVGGERERAEVLAAVKKGILKRTDSNQSSPSLRPTDLRNTEFGVPNIPHMTDSPRSSAPSTPVDEAPRSSHRRNDSVAIEDHDNPDYFGTVTRYASLDSKTNGPLTPQTSVRNISFSPRIQFHDTWPSFEYDRRGEIATCNRLTPTLAQQIKEELNTFKMVSHREIKNKIIANLLQEMEVHETSKVYTHFF